MFCITVAGGKFENCSAAGAAAESAATPEAIFSAGGCEAALLPLTDFATVAVLLEVIDEICSGAGGGVFFTASGCHQK